MITFHSNKVTAPADLKAADIMSGEVDGITVVYMCPLLDGLFGTEGWYTTVRDRSEVDAAVAEWMRINDVHLHAWDGESYRRLAEQDRGIEAARKAGKSIVLIEPLS